MRSHAELHAARELLISIRFVYKHVCITCIILYLISTCTGDSYTISSYRPLFDFAGREWELLALLYMLQ